MGLTHIQVYEGERVHDDKEQLELSNILYAPRDVPEIEVTFNVDINSILNIMSHATAIRTPALVRATRSHLYSRD